MTPAEKTEAARASEKRLWPVIRFKEVFTIKELAMTADVPVGQAMTFVGALTGVGVLVALPFPPGGATRETKYRLMNSLGPKVPHVMRIRVLEDPNSGYTLVPPCIRRAGRPPVPKQGEGPVAIRMKL